MVNPGHQLPDTFKSWIVRQYRGAPIVEDSFILSKRQEYSWLYYDNVRENYIKDIIKTRGQVYIFS